MGPHRWEARFEMLAPHYTTDWDQLPQARWAWTSS
ncbi:DUF4113 domain-containing protein [Herbaspirillum seropedicae]